MRIHWVLLFAVLITACGQQKKQSLKKEQPKLKALIIDGSNNHYIWPKSTKMMQRYLEETDLFEVTINRSDSIWLGIKYNPNRSGTLNKYIEEYGIQSNPKASENPLNSLNTDIDFKQYDLVISNLGAMTPHWPEKTKRNFEQYMKDGGGFVLVHAANNAWGDWEEFNKMIGLGAWGDRDSVSGPYAYYNDQHQLIVDPTEGQCGSHGLEHEFVMTTRADNHPIMKDLPTEWLHTQDEMYDRMRGPFQNATILATAYSDIEKNEQPWEPSVKGTGWNVPMLMAINYGKGRVFHTTLGHFDYSMECVGFITTLQRGSEWAATGKVTQSVPENFPTKEKLQSITWVK